MAETEGVRAVKLVKKSGFRKDAFDSVDEEAQKVIDSAQPNQILALTLTRNSPLKVAEARLFDKGVFEAILSDK